MRGWHLLLVPGLLCAQAIAPQSKGAGQELVVVETLKVEGTRFPARSIETLSGLHTGQRINENTLRRAIDKMLECGLIKSVDYNYESAPEAKQNPRAVALTLSIVDEAPLLPASIDIPGVEAERVWEYVASLDPLFTRELPRTQKALRFYSHAITDYLRTNKRQDTIVPIITGDAGGNATGIIFKPAVGRTVPKKTL